MRAHGTTSEPDPRDLSRAELAAYLRSVPVVSVLFAGTCLGLSRPSSYRAAVAGQIRCLVIGRRKVTPSAWLERVLELHDEEEADR